jgi:hypothetical protein
MTTAQANQSFGSPESLFSSSDIASALETSGVADLVRGQLRGFTQATRSQAVNEVERITAELTDLNPLQVIIDALSTYHELREAGRRTINEPDSEELVELIEHQVTFQNEPSIKVVVDGKQIASLHMLFSLIFQIQALTATVRAGRLTVFADRALRRYGKCRHRRKTYRAQAGAGKASGLDSPRRWPTTGDPLALTIARRQRRPLNGLHPDVIMCTSGLIVCQPISK